MTPQELQEKARKVSVLEEQISLINNKNAYIIIHFDGARPFIRTQHTSPIYLDGHLEDFANFIGETVRTKMLLNREERIKELCNE